MVTRIYSMQFMRFLYEMLFIYFIIRLNGIPLHKIIYPVKKNNLPRLKKKMILLNDNIFEQGIKINIFYLYSSI